MPEKQATRIVRTNFPHPEIKTGQHTNGPGTVWVQADGEWINTKMSSLFRVERALKDGGVAGLKKMLTQWSC